MIELTYGQMNAIAPLFAYTEETMVLSVLQGHMGRAWADSAEHPTAARILVGDLMFLAGDAQSPCAQALVTHIPAERQVPFVLAAPEHAGWSRLIKENWPETRREYTRRYAIKKEPDCFDPEKLRAFAGRIPAGYAIRPIDSELYPKTFGLPFPADLCTNFESADHFLSRGIGYVALFGGEIVGGASSYTVYDDGIEIEIATHPEHRRRGLATALGATLILGCLDRGLYPSWDAANIESVGLAEKLGYHLAAPYDCYVLYCGDVPAL